MAINNWDSLVGQDSEENLADRARAEGWLESVRARLDRVRKLPANWDSYGSAPPSAAALARAEELLQLLAPSLPPLPAIVPVPGGGVQLEWQVGQRALELEILPDGSVEYLKVDGEHMEEGPLEASRLDRVVDLVRWFQVPGSAIAS